MTLDEFAAECRRLLLAHPGPDGRAKVCEALRGVLKDESFLARHLGDDVPERKVLYEDPSLGFTILAHHYRGAKESGPHDHGPTWAIYGQARGATVMSDWTVLEPATESRPGKVRRARSYTLEPGDAKVYNEGDVHSPRRDGPTKLIRIEGVNMDRVKRLSFEPVSP